MYNLSAILKLKIIFFFLVGSYASNAQLFVTDATVPPFNPVNLVENVFLGSGVDVININYTGAPMAMGYFDGNSSNINLNRGILMTSGDANNAVGPNNNAGLGTQNSGVSDPDLVAITGNTIDDASIITIDFIPYSDTLRFRYVFASEEYDEFVCSGVNDAFGFFISGPGINGPFANNSANIALIPGTTTPVTIDNVNNGGGGCMPTNVGYYINNDNGITVQYDAFTTVLTATAVVMPCNQYKIKLAIGDAGDDIYDSGVFLQANSFGTNALNVSVLSASPDTTVVEGCLSGSIVFELDEPTTFNYPITYNVWGTAVNGVDYELLPGTLIIPAGEDSTALVFNPFEDGIPESLETIVVEINTNACKQDTIYMYIRDNELVAPIVDNVSICPGDPITLDATLPTILPTSTTFTNNTPQPIPDNDIQNPITSDINLTGVIPTVITANTILSVCIDITHPWDSDLDIYLISPDGQVLELATDLGPAAGNFTNTCFTLDATDFIKDITAAGAPFTGNFQPEGPWSDIFGGASNGAWTLQVSDDANGFTGTLNSWSITVPPTYSVTYSWSPTNDLTCTDCPVTIASPSVETTYWVTATDSYGCFTEDSVLVSMLADLPAPAVTCTVSGTSITFSWMPILGGTGYEVNVDNGGWIPANGTLMHTVAGAIGQTISIEVRGLSATCNALSGTTSCMIPNCSFSSVINSTADINCNGGSDGSISITATSGTAPYQYSLNSGTPQANGTFSNLTAGMYTIDMTDDLGCSTSQTITLLEPLALGISVTGADISCFGANDGSATMAVTGGVLPYNINWDNSATTFSISGLSPNTYTVTVTDNNGCAIVDNVIINEPLSLNVLLATTDISCAGANDGSLVATVSGGTANYDYLWSTNATTSSISGLNSGTYFLSVTDANSCLRTASAVVTEPLPILLSSTSISASCNGGSDGAATISASDGIGMYTYTWDAATGNQATATANNLPFGNYTVTVSDANGCQATATVGVGELSSVVFSLSATDVNCFGDTDGTATAMVTAGTAPLTYVWSTTPPQNMPTATGLAAGNYVITITDAGGCNVIDNITINGPTQIISTSQSTDITCNGANDGSASISASGGTPGYTYLWNDALLQTTSTISGLSQGTFIVTITDTNNCTSTNSVTISEPSFLTNTISGTDVSCNGGSDGGAAIVASGGTPNYTYLWSNLATTASISNLTSGTYTVTVFDNNGCASTNTITINQPTPISITSTIPNPVSCFGGSNGSIVITASGGTAPLTYSADNGGTFQLGNTFSGLPAGTYTIVVQDANSCQTSSSTTISEPTALSVTSITSTPESCFGNDGTATVAVTGGTGALGAYTYLWTPSGQSTSTAIGLATANYTVLVTDLNGCTITSTVNVGGPSPILLTTSGNPASCSGSNDGSATVTATGGTGGFTYQWDAAAGNQITSTATNLAAGTYQVTVSDMSGCTETASVNLNQPDALLVSATSSAVTCFGEQTGSATASSSGGTPPYTYLWDAAANSQNTVLATGLGAGTYTVSVFDNNGCSSTTSIVVNQPGSPVGVFSITNTSVNCNGGSDGTATVIAQGGTMPYTYLWNDTNNQTLSTAIGLVAGNYVITITDANGCQQTGTTTLTEPTPLAIQLSQQSASCNGGIDGTATASASGGTGSIVYTWSNNQTGPIANGLTGGATYSVTATDANNCSISGSILIDNPAPIILASLVTNAECFGGDDGSIEITPNGGTMPYSYVWSSNTGNQTNAIATQLSSGVYAVTVTDVNGCSAQTAVQLTHPIEFSWDFSSEEVTCFGDSTGTASIQVNGGSPGYTYLWSDKNQQTTSTATGLIAGNYQITVTDAVGCTFTDGTIVEQPALPLSVNFAPFSVSCNGGRDGSIDVFGIGGTPPYSYSVDGNYYNSANNINALMAGTYTLYTKDSRACIFETTVTVPEPPLFTVDAGNDTLIEFGESVQFQAIVNNNPLNNDYLWTTQSPAGSLSCTDCIDPLSTPEYDITYFLQATNAAGCIAQDEITVRVEEVRRVFLATAFTPNDDTNNDFFYVQGGYGTERVVSLRVYDRWGELVFENRNTPLNDAASGWNGTFKGKDMNSGVFAWTAEILFYDEEVILYHGDVTLLR